MIEISIHWSVIAIGFTLFCFTTAFAAGFFTAMFKDLRQMQDRMYNG